MTQEEMADILNTWLVMNREGVTGSVDDGRILPVTVNTCTYSGFRVTHTVCLRCDLSSPHQ